MYHLILLLSNHESSNLMTIMYASVNCDIFARFRIPKVLFVKLFSKLYLLAQLPPYPNPPGSLFEFCW